MVAPVSNSRAPHDGFAVLVLIILIIVACLAGYWYARQSVRRPVAANIAFEKSG
jgi:hypothetical protein